MRWEPLIQSLQHFGGYIVLVMLLTWLNFGRILSFFFSEYCCCYCSKFRMCFFTIKQTFGHFLQNVGLIAIHLDAGPTIRLWHLTSPMTLTLGFEGQILTQLYISGKGSLNDVKWNRNILIRYCANYWSGGIDMQWRDVSWLDAGPTMWPRPLTLSMTLTLDF